MISSRGGSQIPQEVGGAVGRESCAVCNSRARTIFIHGIKSLQFSFQSRQRLSGGFGAMSSAATTSEQRGGVSRGISPGPRYVPVTRTNKPTSTRTQTHNKAHTY